MQYDIVLNVYDMVQVVKLSADIMQNKDSITDNPTQDGVTP